MKSSLGTRCKELVKACRLLEEYAQYVDQVRRFAGMMSFEEAVEQAVDYCIRNNILADFLTRNRAEAAYVPEFDEKKIREDWCSGKLSLYRILISTYRKQGMERKEVKKQLITELKLEEKEIDNLIDTFWDK